MNEEKKRELLPDVLRGFAIFLVVMGHSIQEGSGSTFLMESGYFDDRLYQLIYSFHMPLFMLISGWLAWPGINAADTKQSRVLLLKKRVQSLLIPVFGWTAFDFIRIFFEHEIKGYPHLGVGQGVIQFFLNALQNLWFLWAVFWCFVIVYGIHFYFKDSILLYVFGFIMIFFIPDGLGLGAYKYMMPYYILAYYAHGWSRCSFDSGKSGKTDYVWRQLQAIYHKSPWLLTAVMGILFTALFVPFFTRDSLIYLTGYKLIGKDIWNQLKTDCYRMLIGFVGSGFVIMVWKQLLGIWKGYHFPILARLGRDSMGIYIVSGYILILGVAPLTRDMTPSYLCNLTETVVVLALSALLTELLGRCPGLCRLVGIIIKQRGMKSI